MQQRQIKFRAWTGSSHEYNVVVGALGAFYVQGLDPKDSASMSPCNTRYGKQTPIEQFTGLLDKYGKEIYEGDIVRDQYADKHEVTIKPFIHEDYEDMWTGVGWALHTDYVDKCEVIGNIHENAELLAPGDQTLFPPQGSPSLHEDEDNQLYDPAKDPTVDREEVDPIPF